MNQLVLFCYDFPSDKSGDRRRAKLVKFLDGHGDRVQYSVFEGRFGSKEELQGVLDRIKKMIDEKQDSVRIYPLTLEVEKKIIIFGKGEIFQRPDVIVL